MYRGQKSVRSPMRVGVTCGSVRHFAQVAGASLVCEDEVPAEQSDAEHVDTASTADTEINDRLYRSSAGRTALIPSALLTMTIRQQIEKRVDL